MFILIIIDNSYSLRDDIFKLNNHVKHVSYAVFCTG